MNKNSILHRAKTFLVERSFQIFVVTVISLMTVLLVYLAKHESKRDKNYPLIIRANRECWRSAGPIENVDEWIVFTDEHGNQIAVRGNVTVKRIDND